MNYTEPEHARAMERIMDDAEKVGVCRHCKQAIWWDNRGLGFWRLAPRSECYASSATSFCAGNSRLTHEPGGTLPDEPNDGHIRSDDWRGEDVDPFDLAEGDGR